MGYGKVDSHHEGDIRGMGQIAIRCTRSNAALVAGRIQHDQRNRLTLYRGRLGGINRAEASLEGACYSWGAAPRASGLVEANTCPGK
jgi:hypothetical protein